MTPSPTNTNGDDVVPIEVFQDHMVMRPPNKLKAIAARAPRPVEDSDRTIVGRAEHALQLLSKEFDGWMEKEIERLDNARRDVAQARSRSALDVLYRSAHDLRGQSATLGFPLAGEIADGLCFLIEVMGERLPPQPLLDRHVQSIMAVVRENVRSRDDQLGIELVSRLALMRDQALKPGGE